MKKKAAIVLVLTVCLLLSGCVSVTEISLHSSISIEVGETAAVELTAKFSKENVSDEETAKALASLVWTSSDEAVATVDEKGNVTAKTPGECEITVTTKNNKTATATVTVKQTATGIELESSEGWIYVDGSVQLNPYTVPAKAAASTYTYKSDNEKVATVSASGAITGMAAGTAKITVTSAEGFTATYSITVQTRATTANPTAGGSTGGSIADGSLPSPPTEQQHYHGNGTDMGRCPVCGVGFGPKGGPGIPDPVPCPICGVVNGPSHWHGDVMVPGICCDYQSTGVHTCGSGGF
ncbi:MAG: Ig-like domain-containing protein [Oscillospiraceae bacterium]